MLILSDINLSISGNVFQIIIGIIAAVFFTYFVYKYTIPQINKTFKIFLIILRSAALILLLFLIFEPILTIITRTETKPVNLIFVDNSKSMGIYNKDGEVKELIQDFNNDNNFEIYTFGTKVKPINQDSISNI